MVVRNLFFFARFLKNRAAQKSCLRNCRYVGVMDEWTGADSLQSTPHRTESAKMVRPAPAAAQGHPCTAAPLRCAHTLHTPAQQTWMDGWDIPTVLLKVFLLRRMVHVGTSPFRGADTRASEGPWHGMRGCMPPSL